MDNIGHAPIPERRLRTRIMTWDDNDATSTKDFIVDNCKTILIKYLKEFKKKSNHYLFRGMEKDNPYFHMDPTLSTRISKGLKTNHYNLLLGILPQWSHYPKRLNSVICSLDYDIAANYGNVYIAYPVNNAKFGICPDSDIWTSFETLIKRWGITGLEYFNAIVNAMIDTCKNIHHNKNEIIIPDNTEFGLKQSLNTCAFVFDNKFAAFITEFAKHPLFALGLKTNNEVVLDIQKYYRGDIFHYFDGLLSPSENGFTLVQGTQNIPLGSKNGNELWSSNECILIREDVNNEVLEYFRDVNIV